MVFRRIVETEKLVAEPKWEAVLSGVAHQERLEERLGVFDVSAGAASFKVGLFSFSASINTMHLSKVRDTGCPTLRLCP